MAGGVRWLQAIDPHSHVPFIGLLEMADHVRRPRGPDDLQRDGSLEDPGRIHDVREADGVVGVKMGQEKGSQTVQFQPFHAPLGGCGSSPYHPGSGVHDVGRPIHDHRHGGTPSVRLGIGCPGSQKDNLGDLG